MLRKLTELGNLPLELREQLEAEGPIFIASKVGVNRHISGHVPGVFAASSVSRHRGGFAFTASRIVALFPTRGDGNLRCIDSRWDARRGPARAAISEKGLSIEIDLHGVDKAFSGAMKLNYKRKIPAEVLDQIPAKALRFSVTPNFVYRAVGVRPQLDHRDR